MKSQLCNALLTAFIAGGVLSAQSSQNSSSQISAASGNGRSVTPLSKKFEKRFAHMTTRYRLTTEQQAQLKAILLKEQEDAQTVSADTLMSRGNKREEIASLHEASQQKIGAILDKKQKRKFDGDEKRRAWMDGRLPEPNPGPPLNF
jgi:chorismate-pyruvate lyase